MKKTLLLLSFFLCGAIALEAQCSIANSCTPSTTTGYCSTPAAGTALPNGTELVAYSTTIQMSLGTTASGATINNATVTAVTGLPTGLTGSTNPGSGIIAGGSDGCILVSGTPATGSAGSYSVTANVTVNTNFGAFPTTLVWPLTINNGVGIAEAPVNTFNLFIVPNPAKSEANLIADINFQKVRLFDALGNLLLTQDANGSYKTTLDLSKLSSGIYFVQIIEGTKMVTRKFIKE